MKTNLKKKNKIWQKYLPILFLFGLMINLTSCYTDYGLTSADYDVVVTKKGYEVITKDVPKTVQLIESLMNPA